MSVRYDHDCHAFKIQLAKMHLYRLQPRLKRKLQLKQLQQNTILFQEDVIYRLQFNCIRPVTIETSDTEFVMQRIAFGK